MKPQAVKMYQKITLYAQMNPSDKFKRLLFNLNTGLFEKDLITKREYVRLNNFINRKTH